MTRHRIAIVLRDGLVDRIVHEHHTKIELMIVDYDSDADDPIAYTNGILKEEYDPGFVGKAFNYTLEEDDI